MYNRGSMAFKKLCSFSSQNYYTMHYDKEELTLVYNKDNEKDKKTLAYAKTISKMINKQELHSVNISSTLFRMILIALGNEPKKVINKAMPFYQSHVRGKSFTPAEWLSILKAHPELLKGPIAFYRNKAVVCNTPTDIYKVKMAD